MDKQAQAVLDFWFGTPDDGDYGGQRKAWFTKSDAFDQQIRTQFESLIERALAGDLDHWCGESTDPKSQLAYIILLDQFTRNIYRNTPRSFAGDPRALAAARDLVTRGVDTDLLPLQRQFCYLPFEHSENLDDQIESLRLFKQLDAFEEAKDLYEYAVKHHEFIDRFGRFPHRNEILGRQSTPEETEFLKQPGSRF